MKGDNLGIGCKAASQQDESIGLDAFQNLLGRLNGKAEEDIKKDSQVRMKLMAQGRYGMRFVKGETYLSSDIEKLREEIRRVAEEKERKAVEVETAPKEGEADRTVRRKRRKKMRECQDKSESSSAAPDPALEIAQKRKEKKRGKKRDKKSNKDKLSSPTPAPSPADNTDSISNSKPKKRKLAQDSARKAKGDDRKKRPKNSSETSTPMPADAPLTGRHALRHRYIAAKRSAVMDAKALNEVCRLAPTAYCMIC